MVEALTARHIANSQSFEKLSLSDAPRRLSFRLKDAVRTGISGTVSPTPAASPEIHSIPPGGLSLDKAGQTYVLANDIVWQPEGDGAAITIVADNVKLDLNGYSIKCLPAADGSTYKTIGVFASKFSELVAEPASLDSFEKVFGKAIGDPFEDTLADLIKDLMSIFTLEGVRICNGHLGGFGEAGITALLCAELNISAVDVADIGKVSLKSIGGINFGIGVIAAQKVNIDRCSVSNVTGLCESLFGTMLAVCTEATVVKSTVGDLHNFDGVVTGHVAVLSSHIQVTGCSSGHLRSNNFGFVSSPGRTVLGFMPTYVSNIVYTDCSAQDIFGCCDDCHGMSLFYVNTATVDGFAAKGVTDGTQTDTGAKATGLEVYGDNVTLSNVHVSDITAICPQDLQSTGISLWGAVLSLTACTAANVKVLDTTLSANINNGLGVGFGWAPDLRWPLSVIPAAIVSYTDCEATGCQVGFDTWKHKAAVWEDCNASDCEIDFLVQPVGAERTLVMNRCSEAPDGFPVAQIITNDRDPVPEWMNTPLPAGFDQVYEKDQTTIALPPRITRHVGDVPGVAMPGLFSMQKECESEWWYYVGSVVTAGGKRFSVQLQMLRNGFPFWIDTVSLGGYFCGLGWSDAEADSASSDAYLFAQGYGLGAENRTAVSKPTASLVIPTAQENSFSGYFIPEVQVTDPRPSTDLRLALGEASHMSIDYVGSIAAATSGERVPGLGDIGAEYVVRVNGEGFLRKEPIPEGEPLFPNLNNSTNQSGVDFDITLFMRDKRGVVMEGDNGYVGPAMFDDVTTSFDNSSYECAQPNLAVSGGMITVAGEKHEVTSGTLWMDRQMLHPMGGAGEQAPLKITKAAELVSAVSKTAHGGKALYCGNWIGLTLDNGICLALAVFWNEKPNLWQSGTDLGHPPKAGFGNLYLPTSMDVKSTVEAPFRLYPRLSATDESFDFDINILDTVPGTIDGSPHWKSDISGITYCSAWRITFGPRLTAIKGFPKEIILRADVRNTENLLPELLQCFSEGAATVFEVEKSTSIGRAFVEQMGFN